jgi:hypothetical protein
MLAEGLVVLLMVYTTVGVLFSIPFALRGVVAVDPGAADSGWGFRLIITPGVIALWPLLLSRWWRGEGARPESNAHRSAAR